MSWQPYGLFGQKGEYIKSQSKSIQMYLLMKMQFDHLQQKSSDHSFEQTTAREEHLATCQSDVCQKYISPTSFLVLLSCEACIQVFTVSDLCRQRVKLNASQTSNDNREFERLVFSWWCYLSGGVSLPLLVSKWHMKSEYYFRVCVIEIACYQINIWDWTF